MSDQQGIYEITNNEGMICYVDTATEGKKTYGKGGVDICESTLNGTILRGEIEKYQYRTHEGEAIDDNPTGFVIKINDEIEAFLPFKLCGKFRESDISYDGDTVAVMVESFDPNSLSIILREITITDQDIDIDLVNEAIDLIEWSYYSPDSHGKIIVPKLQSMKIIDFAKAIATSVGKDKIKFHKIPIRNGEKLHEEMISSIEMQRTEDTDSEKYMAINWERNNEDYNHTPLNSEFYVMDSDEAYSFLLDKGVLN